MSKELINYLETLEREELISCICYLSGRIKGWNEKLTDRDIVNELKFVTE